MGLLNTFLATLVLSLAAGASDAPLQGHALRVFAIDNPGNNWITQDDVDSAERIAGSNGHATLRLHLKEDAAKRLLSVTGANVGKTVRFTWDGKTVSELKVQGAFGHVLELPAPPT